MKQYVLELMGAHEFVSNQGRVGGVGLQGLRTVGWTVATRGARRPDCNALFGQCYGVVGRLIRRESISHEISGPKSPLVSGSLSLSNVEISLTLVCVHKGVFCLIKTNNTGVKRASGLSRPRNGFGYY